MYGNPLACVQTEESMAESQWVAVCCYKNRDIMWGQCAECQREYGCLGFRSSAELVHFNELIPPSMLGQPLPLNLWPKLWKTIEPNAQSNSVGDPTPVQLFIEALGLTCLTSPAAGYEEYLLQFEDRAIGKAVT